MTMRLQKQFVLFRVASTPVECSHWELCVELGEERQDVEISKSGTVYTVSIKSTSALVHSCCTGKLRKG